MNTDDEIKPQNSSVCLTCRREKDTSPFTYEETRDAVHGMILEGIERGESLVSILEAAVVDLIPLPDAEAIMAHLKQINQEQIDFYKSPSHKWGVCSRCHVVTDKENMFCGDCNDARIKWSDGVPVTDQRPSWLKATTR